MRGGARLLVDKAMAPDRTHRIVSSRLTLNVSEWGDPAAPPLILQHGGRDHSRSWDDVAAAFVPDYRIIAPDLRGHGDSEWTNDGDYHVMDFVYDFATIADALALPPCPIVAHSFGGAIAIRYAALYPERVTRFINIEGLGYNPERQAKQDAVDTGERFRKWFDLRRKMLGWTPKRYPDAATVAARLREIDERLSPALADHLAREGTRPNDDGTVSLKYDPAMHPNPPIDISLAVRLDLWRRISCPLLFVYGTESFASNPAADGRLDHFQDARLELFEDAGHWVHHDRQADFIALAKDFLNG